MKRLFMHRYRGIRFCSVLRYLLVKLGDGIIYLAGFCVGNAKSKREMAAQYIAAGRVFMENKENLYSNITGMHIELRDCVHEKKLYLQILQDLYNAYYRDDRYAQDRIYLFLKEHLGFGRTIGQ